MPKGADTFIQEIARKAGDAVLGLFGKVGVEYVKSDQRFDVVTKADLLSEEIIVSAIKKTYPEHHIVAEESGETKADGETEYLWAIDPIDGTQNFAAHIPLFGTMVCLIHRDEVILSAIYIPTSNEMFFAEKGKGAFLNGVRIYCSNKETLHNSSGSSSSTLQGKSVKFMQHIIEIADKTRIQMRSVGAFSINACYTACGRKDWYAPFAGSVWDFAPTSLLLAESGCKVTDAKGNPWKIGCLEMVAANPTLHKELLKLTRDI